MARLLGVRLLKLDATVVIAPADVTAPTSVGGSLAEAVQRIDEGAALLAEARRPGPSSRVGPQPR